MLITNRQAIMCAAVFGSMLQKAGVMTNVYELCDVDLKDFSLQGDYSFCDLFICPCLLFLVADHCVLFVWLLFAIVEQLMGKKVQILFQRLSLKVDSYYVNYTVLSYS